MLSKKSFLQSAGPNWSSRRQPASSLMNIVFVWKHMIPTVPVTDDSVNISSTWTTTLPTDIIPRVDAAGSTGTFPWSCPESQHDTSSIRINTEYYLNQSDAICNRKPKKKTHFYCIHCLKMWLYQSQPSSLDFFFPLCYHRFQNRQWSLLIHDCLFTFVIVTLT